MNASDVVLKIERSIGQGTPKELMRAACYSIVIDDFGGLTRAHVDRLHDLSRSWWAAYDGFSDEQLAEIDHQTVEFYKAAYGPPTPEPEHRGTNSPREPMRGMTQSGLPPISELEAKWILRCLDNEDHMREFAHYASLVGIDGALPIEPLLAIENRSVYGHALSPVYRARQIDRAWGTRRKVWEYELIEDALLAATIGSGRLLGRERNRVAWRLVPYLPRLGEKAINTHAKRIESELLRRGVFRRISRQCVRLTEDAAHRVAEQLVPAWISYSVEDNYDG